MRSLNYSICVCAKHNAPRYHDVCLCCISREFLPHNSRSQVIIIFTRVSTYTLEWKLVIIPIQLLLRFFSTRSMGTLSFDGSVCKRRPFQQKTSVTSPKWVKSILGKHQTMPNFFMRILNRYYCDSLRMISCLLCLAPHTKDATSRISF